MVILLLPSPPYWRQKLARTVALGFKMISILIQMKKMAKVLTKHGDRSRNLTEGGGEGKHPLIKKKNKQTNKQTIFLYVGP